MQCADTRPTPKIIGWQERAEEHAAVRAAQLAAYAKHQQAGHDRRSSRRIDRRKSGAPVSDYAVRLSEWHDQVAAEVLGTGRCRSLRSDEIPILKDGFVAKVHRAHKLRYGRNKTESLDTFTKLGALEEPYVNFTADMIGLIRADIDGIWANMADLVEHLGQCLDRDVWPTFIVYDTDDAGRIISPHFYWSLEHSVCATRNGRKAPLRLLKAVRRGICHALLPMFCDPGGLRHALHGKNPCSRVWQVEVLSNKLHDLSVLAEAVDLGIGEAELFRLAAGDRAGPTVAMADGGVVPSNEFFNVLQKTAFEIVPAHKAAGASLDEFRAELAMLACRISTGSDERKAVAIAMRVADWVWGNYDPSKGQSDRPERGRLSHLTEGMDLHQRQAAGGRDVAARRKASSLERAVEAYASLVADDLKPTQEAVCERANLSRRIVQRLWADVTSSEGLSVTSNVTLGSYIRCIDKKVGSHGCATPPIDTIDVVLPPADDMPEGTACPPSTSLPMGHGPVGAERSAAWGELRPLAQEGAKALHRPDQTLPFPFHAVPCEAPGPGPAPVGTEPVIPDVRPSPMSASHAPLSPAELIRRYKRRAAA